MTPADYRQPAARRAALAVLFAVSTLSQAAASGGKVVMPLFALQLGASPLNVGAIMACYAVLSFLLSVRAGQLVDRMGPRWPLVLGVIGQIVGLSIPAFWHSLWGLAVGAAIIGPSGGLFLIASQNMAGVISDDDSRANTYSWLTITQSGAQLVGPPLAGLLIDYAGHPASFATLAAVSALSAAILIAMRARIPAGGHGAAARRGALELLKLPALVPVFIVCALIPFSWELFFFFVPLRGSALGFPATTIGLVYSCLSLTVIASRAAVPWLLRRVGDWTLVAIALGMAGTVFLVFPLVDSAPAMMATAVLLGAGMGPSQPVVLSLLYRVAPEGRKGEALGVRSSMIFGAQIVGPLTLGALGVGLGLAGALWPFALMLLAGSRYAYTRGARAAPT